MKLTLYQIDAFADKCFKGNPAAICPLENWLPDELMQSIAAENNLSETAFFVPTEQGYHIRWFTPTREVDLCGHATLAAAYVVFNTAGSTGNDVTFESRSGPLSVKRNSDWLEMDFPAQPARECDIPEPIRRAFHTIPIACLRAEDYLVVFDHEQDILAADPEPRLLKELDLRGVAITAPGDDYDFVTRFFAPRYGIEEDPVTGSAFTQLVPYWSNVLGKKRLVAKQVSRRTGEIRCEYEGDRVKIAGQAVKYMKGTIEVAI